MSEVLKKFRDIVGPGGLLCGEDVASRVAQWGTTEPCRAQAILRPRTTEEVSSILKICNDTGQKVVPQGGMTGLVRGGYATSDEIGLSLERMNEIEEIDKASGTMTVQAGVPLQVVQEAAQEAGFLYPVDLGARGTASIGGNISTNAGGNTVIRYGMTRDSILGVEAVLADGTVIDAMCKLIKNNVGYDIKQNFIGTEGTIGIVTRAVLRLRPNPISVNTAFLGIADFDSVVTVLRRLEQELGGTLSSYEVMWKEFYEGLTKPVGRNDRPMPAEHEYYVLLEAQGSDIETDRTRFEQILGECLEAGLLENAMIAQSEGDRKAFWAIRDDVGELKDLLDGPTISFDISIPIPHMQAYVADVRKALAEGWERHGILVFGHLGDGNLHITVSVYDDSEEAHLAVDNVVYSRLEGRGGSVSAEHGIGLSKKDFLHMSRGPEELAMMRAIKSALDPKNILNPGKIF